MLISTYFERLYPHIKAGLYYPSRKNSGILVLRIFDAAGSDRFQFVKGKRYTSGDVPLERKLYDGSRKLTDDIKASFSPFNESELSDFFREHIDDNEIRAVMLAFGIPPTTEVNADCLCRALAIQLRAFINSDTEEADDIVSVEYQKLLIEPKDVSAKTSATYQPASVLYPGDQIYMKTKYRPVYSVNIYEKFQHTWEFENVGTQTWRGRKLFFSNSDAVRPKAEGTYIEIPDTPPHKGVKLTVAMDARGFEGSSECKWIMVDSEDNDCFPNSNTFVFVVNAKFEYEKQTEVIQ